MLKSDLRCASRKGTTQYEKAAVRRVQKTQLAAWSRLLQRFNRSRHSGREKGWCHGNDAYSRDGRFRISGKFWALRLGFLWEVNSRVWYLRIRFDVVVKTILIGYTLGKELRRRLGITVTVRRSLTSQPSSSWISTYLDAYILFDMKRCRTSYLQEPGLPSKRQSVTKRTN